MVAVDSAEVHRRAVQAVADALELAAVQTALLREWQDADERGDEEAVQNCHARLDHVMDQVAEVDAARRGTRRDEAELDTVTCGGCGDIAEPTFTTPKLLGYACRSCGWTAHDPAAQAAQKAESARAAAAEAVVHQTDEIAAALADLDNRKLRARGLDTLRTAHRELAAVRKRIEHADA
jgi:exonuclease VII small subunit